MYGARRWGKSDRSAGRLRVRRTGLVVLLLFFGTAAAALALARVYRLGVTQTLVAVLVGGGAPAGLYVAWATYRESQAGSGDLSLAEIADQFAAAVGMQWETEARIRPPERSLSHAGLLGGG
jgi:hypothetical protein